MLVKGAAAHLTGDLSNPQAIRLERASSRIVDMIEQRVHHTTAEEGDGGSAVGLGGGDTSARKALGRAQHAQLEPEPSGACEKPRKPRDPKGTSHREQRSPDALVAERAEYETREWAGPVTLVQPLPRYLEPASVAHAGRANGLASPAAKARIEVLDERRVIGLDLSTLEGAHENDSTARAVGLVSSGQVCGAGRQAESAVDTGRERVAHSPPSRATLRHCPGSKLSRSRPTI